MHNKLRELDMQTTGISLIKKERLTCELTRKWESHTLSGLWLPAPGLLTGPNRWEVLLGSQF